MTSVPDPLAIIALVVAVVAALFTGWQAWTAHLERRSRGRAKLMLIGYPLADNQEGNRWSVHNLGDGTATNVVVEALIQGHGGVPGMTFLGEVSEPIHGMSTVPVEFPKRTWPGAWNTYRDYPDVYVWEGATARARWVDSAGRAHFRSIRVEAPLPTGEPF